MLNLTLAAIAFVAAHFLISSTGLRQHLVGRLGERAFAGTRPAPSSSGRCPATRLSR
jgi:hypothetical protein